MTLNNDFAYRGYLVHVVPNGACWIEKNHTRVSFAHNASEAHRIIDSLLN